MSPDWSEHFHYDYFRELLLTAQHHFTCCLLKDAPQILARRGKPTLLLRHDVDISLKRALPMAEIENHLGVPATYMVMVDSPLYDLTTPESKSILYDLMGMGHEVALHFTVPAADPEQDGGAWKEIEGHILRTKTFLEDIIQAEVASVSFHRPITRFLRGPLLILNLVNAYSRELMDWYLSDSRGRWREGEPLGKLRHPGKPLLQLLIHPIWWGAAHLAAKDRMEEFFQSEAEGRSLAEQAIIGQELANALGSPYRGANPGVW